MSTTEILIPDEVQGNAPIVTYEKAHLPALGLQTQQAGLIEVDDETTMNLAIEAGLQLKRRRDVIEAKRAQYVKPLNDLKAVIQADFVPVLADYDEAIGVIKNKVGAFVRQERARVALEEAAAAQAARAAREAAEKAAKAAEKKGDTEKAEAIREVAAVTPAPYVAPRATIAGGSGTRKTWKCRVLDKAAALAYASQHNANLFEFNQSAGNDLARAFKAPSTIPGLEFYEDEGVTLRG